MTNEIINQRTCEELTRLLRIQRHDFINHMQVIHSLLQLGRTERAIRYIEELAKDPESMSQALNEHVRSKSCNIDHS